MGNSNSGLVCCHAFKYDEQTYDEKEKCGNTSRTTDTSISSSKKEPVQQGYSFSSISSKSSSCCNEEEEHFQPAEMRNDAAEWCNSACDEIRVAHSSYDEETTEAVNNYYCDSRYNRHQRGRRDGGHQRRDQ